MANTKNESIFLVNKCEIRKKDEIKIIAYLNRVIISINEYGHYNFKKVFYNWTIYDLQKKILKNDEKNKQDFRRTLRFRRTLLRIYEHTGVRDVFKKNGRRRFSS